MRHALAIAGSALLAASLAGLAGCAPRTEVREQAPALSGSLRAGDIVAVGGVTAATTVGRLAPLDAADAADALYLSLMFQVGGPTVWHANTVVDQAQPGEVEAILAELARYGRVPADRLTALVPSLPGVRYLALARIERDHVETRALELTGSDPESRAEGLADHGEPWGRAMSTRREVTVSLRLYDLTDGGVAFDSEAQVKDNVRYEYAASPLDVEGRLAAAAPADTLAAISRRGDALRLPDLVEMLQAAFGELAGRLPAGAAPAAPEAGT